MSSINSYPDDTNLDANTLLSELDKGLRSVKMGEECEAIVGFRWLFSRYPFPILINSASLKLAEVFRISSNFSRLLILKVFQESEKHLDKIINIDEFVRRLFSVTFSNDPIARGITLRTLGAISRIVSDRKNIQHTIRNSLDSQDEVEIMAAIEAASSFAKISKEFALSIYPKVLSMLSKDIPLETKVALLSVLHHSHYNSTVSQNVRSCLEQLTRDPPPKFLVAALHTLTHIATSCIFHIPEHINYLLSYFRGDTPKEVRYAAIKELETVASICPHLWSQENVSNFLNILLQQPNFKFYIMKILTHLVKCPCLTASEDEFAQFFRSSLLNLSLETIRSSDEMRLIGTCFEMLTALSQSSKYIREETIKTIEEFVFKCSTRLDEKFHAKENQRAFKIICKCIVTLCDSQESSDCIVIYLEQMMENRSLSPQWLGYICEVMCALKSLNTSNGFTGKLIELIKHYGKDKVDDILIKLITLFFQVSKRKNERCLEDFIYFLGERSQWFFYCLVRQAMRYGHHNISMILCKRLVEESPSENIHFWMLALYKVSCAEEILARNISTGKCLRSISTQNSRNSIVKETMNDPLEDDTMTKYLRNSIDLYASALSALKANSYGDQNGFNFPCEYLKLRCRLLQAHLMLRTSFRMIRACSISSRDDSRNGGTFINMRKVGKEFRTLGEAYCGLYEKCFNSDQISLDYIQLIGYCCIVLGEKIGGCLESKRAVGIVLEMCTVELVSLVEMLNRISSLDVNGDAKKWSQLIEYCDEFVSSVCCLPRLFYQSIQNCNIKLAVNGGGDSVNAIEDGGNCVIQIEGVVVGECKKRKVCKVYLNVSDMMIGVEPVNDYFQISVILTNRSNNHIHIHANICDENNQIWKTGPHFYLPIKSVGDP